MANIVDAQAIKFSNEHVRPMADKIMQMYYDCLMFEAEYTTQELAPFFTNNADVLIDGAEVDGRKIITAADVKAIKAQVDEFITDVEKTSKKKHGEAAKVAVNYKS